MVVLDETALTVDTSRREACAADSTGERAPRKDEDEREEAKDDGYAAEDDWRKMRAFRVP